MTQMPSLCPWSSENLAEAWAEHSKTEKEILSYNIVSSDFSLFLLILDHHNTSVLLMTKIVSKMIIQDPFLFIAIQNSNSSCFVLTKSSAQRSYV